MTIEKTNLIYLRNELINTPIGSLLFQYLHDFVTGEACKNIDPTEIKGMCKLIQEIKNIPDKVKEQ